MGLESYLLDLASKCSYSFYSCEARTGLLKRNLLWSGHTLRHFDYAPMLELSLFDKGLRRLLKTINQPTNMKDSPADSRAFSRPPSQGRGPGNEGGFYTE